MYLFVQPEEPVNKNLIIICGTILTIFSALFYWSLYRPVSIRTECQKIYDQHLENLYRINQKYEISDSAPKLMRTKYVKYGDFDSATFRVQYRFPEEVFSGITEGEKAWLEPQAPSVKESAMCAQAAKSSFDSCLNKHGLNPDAR